VSPVRVITKVFEIVPSLSSDSVNSIVEYANDAGISDAAPKKNMRKSDREALKTSEARCEVKAPSANVTPRFVRVFIEA